MYNSRVPPIYTTKLYASNIPIPNTPMKVQTPEEFMISNDADQKYLPALRKVGNYNTVIICDDSGSMDNISDSNNNVTRWSELISDLELIIKTHDIFNTKCDIYFINRLPYGIIGVNNIEQIRQFINYPPDGGTNLLKTLKNVYDNYVTSKGSDVGKDLIIHILTDGEPSNNSGNPDVNCTELKGWLTSRPDKEMEKIFFSFVLCTNEETTVKTYKKLEKHNGLHIDVTDDYHSEHAKIIKKRGSNIKYSKFDHMAKLLCAPYDKTIDNNNSTERQQQECCIMS
jgi:hypothetical protein